MANRAINNRQKVSYRQPQSVLPPLPRAKLEQRKRGRPPLPPVRKTPAP